MPRQKYREDLLNNDIKKSGGVITPEIFKDLNKKYKLARLIKWVIDKVNLDTVDKKYKTKLENQKITGKLLLELIENNNLTITENDLENIQKFTIEKPKILLAERKLLKQFNKTKFTPEEQEKYVFNYETEFNPYKQELNEYLKSKGKNQAIELQSHQRRFLEAFFYANLRGAVVFWGVGTGKTLGAVGATKMYLNIYPKNNVFFILPPALMGNMANSLIDFGIDISDNRIKFYTYDAYYRHGIPADNSLVIVDEAHNFRTDMQITSVSAEEGTRETRDEAKQNKKGFALLTKAGLPAHKIILMTGTPFVNTPYDIENLISMAEAKTPLSMESFGYMVSDEASRYDYFKYRISHYMDDGSGGYFPNVKYIYEPIIVKDEKQLKILQQNADKHNPFYIHSRTTSEKLDGLKTDFIIKKIKDNPEYKTIIFSNFIEHGVQQMMDKLRENDIPYVRISGQETLSEKQDAIFRYSPEKAPADVRKSINPVKVLIITRAGAEGVDTSETRQLFVISGQWNEALYEQIVARASRYKSHHSLPEKERFVNVYKLFLCSEKEAKEIIKFNDPNYDFLATLNIIKEAKEADKKNEKKYQRAKTKFDLVSFDMSKKGSNERKELINSADFANKKATYMRQEIVSGAFGNKVSADCMLFLIQKSKIQIIENFVKELDKIPQVEKTISDIPFAKKIYDELLTKNIKDGKIMPYLVETIAPLKKTILAEFGKLDREISTHKEKITEILNKFANKDFKKKSKKLLAINQEFFTSDKDANELVNLSNVKNMFSSPLQVLEPTAGHGALVKALLKSQPNKDFRVDMVEYLNDNREILKELVNEAPLLLNLMKEGNFFKFVNSTTYDLIIMNPPFHLRKSLMPDLLIKDVYDIDFVKRAYAMLKEGGVLVAIVSQHWKNDTHYKHWLESKNWIHKDRTQVWESIEGREAQKIASLPITMLKITKNKLDMVETRELLDEKFYYTQENKISENRSKVETFDLDKL